MCEELSYQIINASAVNQAAFFKNNGGIKFNGKQYRKYIFVENNKIEILYYTIYSDFFPKTIFKVIFIYKKLDKMLKQINIKLKFIKEDKKMCHFKPSQLKKNAFR